MIVPVNRKGKFVICHVLCYTYKLLMPQKLRTDQQGNFNIAVNNTHWQPNLELIRD